MPSRRRSLVSTILFAGAVAGTLDILDPIVFYYVRSHVSPERILQSVAAGALGKAAFSGGVGTAAFGLFLHFCIATLWAALFVVAARYIAALRRHAVVSGLLYGLFIYAVMNFVVLPQSRMSAPVLHWTLPIVNGICAIVFLVGLPIALIARRF